ncbi:MAG: ABC transporter permease [Chitinophagaceae bacterium]|nr:ABC transporter permease [Chitinophagaceae bacterium]
MQHLNQLYALTKRNVIIRYKHSVVGFLWGFIKPLIYLLIFIVIFSAQFSSVNNYVLYATSGILFWFFFSNVVSQGVQSIIQSSGILKSVNVSPILFPLAEVLTELFNLFLALIVYFVVMHWFGIHYTFQLLWILPILFIFSIFSFSITLTLAALNVYFRDIGILWNTIQPAIFYLTPIAYTEELIPARFSYVIKLNPIYYFIKLFRYPLYESLAPDFRIFIICTVISFISLATSLFIFNRLKNQFITAI